MSLEENPDFRWAERRGEAILGDNRDRVKQLSEKWLLCGQAIDTERQKDRFRGGIVTTLSVVRSDTAVKTPKMVYLK